MLAVQPQDPSVVAVLLNWNGMQVLPAAVESLLAQEYSNLRIILVDNASTDGSLQWAMNNHPQLHLVRHPQNLGYAEGCNAGIRKALDWNAEYILLINNDVTLHGQTLRILVQESQTDSLIGVVGPSIWRRDIPELLDAAYGRICFNHVIVTRLGVSQKFGLGFTSPCDVDCVFGSIMLVRSEAFRRVGMLDSEFWMFLEEVDFCYRVRVAGYRVRYFPAARAVHVSGHSVRRAGAELMKIYLLRRNSVLFMRKHGTPACWLKFVGMAGLSLAALFLDALVRARWGPFHARCSGYWDGMLRRPLDAETLLVRYGAPPAP